MKCSVDRGVCLLTPTRNPQGFGPFSPSAGTERPSQRERTALVQGADGDLAQRTSLEDVAPWARTCLGIRPQSSSALQDKQRTTPGKTGSHWSLSWPHTRDQRPAFPPSQECSPPITKPQIQQQTLRENPNGKKRGCASPSPAERATLAGAATSLECPAEGSGAAWPPLPSLLILSPFASMCRALQGSQRGSSHHARSGGEAPLWQQLLG